MERVLGSRLGIMVIVSKMQLGLMSGKSTLNDVFILRRLEEKYHAKGKMFYVL